MFEPLAQLVEHLTFNQVVVGSIPTRLTIFQSPSSSPAQDTALSRQRRRFKSGWGRHKKIALMLLSGFFCGVTIKLHVLLSGLSGPLAQLVEQ
jgi:hypothetical protein